MNSRLSGRVQRLRNCVPSRRKSRGASRNSLTWSDMMCSWSWRKSVCCDEEVVFVWFDALRQSRYRKSQKRRNEFNPVVEIGARPGMACTILISFQTQKDSLKRNLELKPQLVLAAGESERGKGQPRASPFLLLFFHPLCLGRTASSSQFASLFESVFWEVQDPSDSRHFLFWPTSSHHQNPLFRVRSHCLTWCHCTLTKSRDNSDLERGGK